MELNNLKPASGSVKRSKRIARGEGSGHGGTATRGHKGAKSRSGYSRKTGFEGGQMPLQRRVPKFGFKNLNRVAYKAINIDVLQELAEAKGITQFDNEAFAALGLAKKTDLIKILGHGTLTAKVEVKANAFSKAAQSAIEAAQGVAIKI